MVPILVGDYDRNDGRGELSNWLHEEERCEHCRPVILRREFTGYHRAERIVATYSLVSALNNDMQVHVNC